jgi:hypothetical protein
MAKNPPSKAHWSYPLFVQHVEPESRFDALADCFAVFAAPRGATLVAFLDFAIRETDKLGVGINEVQ